MKSKYIGHPSQLYGVRETRMVGGKADGMRLLEVRNGKGLELTVSLDRCADIPYLYYKGNSMTYVAPCGMVAPQYYDNRGLGFLKGFTTGFITTCGLTAAGKPCTDGGEELPLHGNISYVPCEQYSYREEADSIVICAVVRDASIFGHQLVIEREYRIGLAENTLTLTDHIRNIGCKKTPYMILYHCNLGYPLLSENAQLSIPSVEVAPRDEHAAEGIDQWHKMIPPTDDFVEQCYYHKFQNQPTITLRNREINTELQMTYNADELDCFTEWKMMGENEYVLGLEPGNCYPDGRDVMRKNGTLKYLEAYGSTTNRVQFTFRDIS